MNQPRLHGGEDRRYDDRWHSQVDERFADLGKRLDHLEGELKQNGESMNDSIVLLEEKLRDVNHSLNNNTQITVGNHHAITGVKEQVVGIKDQLDEAVKAGEHVRTQLDDNRKKLDATVTSSAQAVSLMQNLTALNRVAEMARNGSKWIFGTIATVAGAIVAIKALFK